MVEASIAYSPSEVKDGAMARGSPHITVEKNKTPIMKLAPSKIDHKQHFPTGLHTDYAIIHDV
jgi:hypothetical protein